MAVAVASWANHECCMRAFHCVWFVCRIVSEVGIVWLRHSPASKSLCVCPTAVFIFTRRLSLWHRLNSLWLLPAGSAPRAHSCSGARQCVCVLRCRLRHATQKEIQFINGKQFWMSAATVCPLRHQRPIMLSDFWLFCSSPFQPWAQMQPTHTHKRPNLIYSKYI